MLKHHHRQNPRLLSFLPVLALATAAPNAGAATTVTLRPNGSSDGTTNGDAFVTTGPSGNLSGINYGGAGAIAVSAAGLANGTFASFLRFDVSAAKAQFDSTYGIDSWVLDTVVLQLTTSNANNAIFNPNSAGSFSVQWIGTDSWTEGSGTPAGSATTGVKWNDVPTLTSGAEAEGTFAIASVADGITASYTLSPSAGLLADIENGGSVSLFLSAADSTMSAVFNSRSFGTASRNPAFILTASPVAVPEPAAPMLILGIAVCGALTRRRA